MQNSICLPIAKLCDNVDAPPRCFICFPEWDMEVRPYPFSQYAIDELNDARFGATLRGPYVQEWCCTLFFPEEWPPGRIKDVLNPAKASIDSGIHLPLWQRLDTDYTITRSFVTFMDGYKEIPYEPFTYDHVAEMMAQTRDIEKLYEYEPSWCLVLWFPAVWLPSEIDEYLRSPIYQSSFFPF